MLSAVRELIRTSGEADHDENEEPVAVFWPVCPQDYHPASYSSSHIDGSRRAVLVQTAVEAGDGYVTNRDTTTTSSPPHSGDASYSLDLQMGQDNPTLVMRDPSNLQDERAVGAMGGGGRPVDEYDAFAYHHRYENNPDRGVEGLHATVREDVNRNSACRRRLGIAIVAISVLVNMWSTLAFLTGSLTPIHSYVNVNGTRMFIYMPGTESDSDRNSPFSGNQKDIAPCMGQVLTVGLAGSCSALFFLVLALVASICVCWWTTGVLRFIRPFLFTLATLAGIISSFFIVRGYKITCDGRFRSSRAEQGVYYIFFGTALTLLHTLLLYVQVSRYPLRSPPPQHQPNEMVGVEENREVVGEVDQQEPDGLLVAIPSHSGS